MTDNADHAHIFDSLLETLSLPEPPAADVIDTMRLFFEAARRPALTAELVDQIEEVCTIISTGKRLAMRYQSDWKAVRGAGSVEGQYWELLIAVLLRWSVIDDNCTDDDRGHAFSRLNAALTAYDLASDKGELRFANELRDWSRDNLEALTATLVV